LDDTVSLWVVNTEGQGAINVTTLTTTLVRQTSATKRDQFMDTCILWVDEVTAGVACGTTEVRHARRIAVNDGNNAVVALIHINAEGDFTCTTVVVHLADAVVRGTRSASEVADYAAKDQCQQQA
jgi:hypothetical protein